MLDSLYLAWKYISFNRVKTVTLVSCITIILFLPTGLEMLLSESEHQLMSRAGVTPLIVGAKGSALDLVMNTLYFDDELPELSYCQILWCAVRKPAILSGCNPHPGTSRSTR